MGLRFNETNSTPLTNARRWAFRLNPIAVGVIAGTAAVAECIPNKETNLAASVHFLFLQQAGLYEEHYESAYVWFDEC